MLQQLNRDMPSATDVTSYPVPWSEAARLRRLKELAIVSPGPDAVLDALVDAACLVTGTPIGLITLIDGERQWFISKRGIEGEGSAREVSFCDYTIRSPNAFVVRNAERDPRFSANPFVTGEEGIRFYAGVPIEIEHGLRLGSLCVLDRVPRRLGHEVGGLLHKLARCAAERMLQSEDRYLLSRIHPARLDRAVSDKAALALAEDALAQGRFTLFFQPKVELEHGQRIGFEALLRIKALDGSIIGPSAFYPAFDEPILSRRIGSFVLRSALSQAKAWERDGMDFGHIAINVSSSQFISPLGSPCLADDIADAVRSADLSPQCLQIEVTEGVMLSTRGDGIGRQLDALRAAGFTVAFDDFGTGFASLVHLREFAYDVIKIDSSFVRAMTSSRPDRAIVAAIIDLAKTLGKRVVAEGVETVEELRMLQALGCHYGQGYLFGRPVRASDIDP